MPRLGCAAAGAAAAAALLWFVHGSAESAKTPADDGVVIVTSPTAADRSPPPPARIPAPAAKLPALPDTVVAHVRQAYPLLTDVAFRCDARGCAVTATIPPPTGDAFLQQRQEMLLGGLAKVVNADGYRMPGPVQMDEVDDNLFHIRAAVTQAP